MQAVSLLSPALTCTGCLVPASVAPATAYPALHRGTVDIMTVTADAQMFIPAAPCSSMCRDSTDGPAS